MPGNWHAEKWARDLAGLPASRRMTLISAAVTLIDTDYVSDALESELTVFLECATGSDLHPDYYDPGLRVDCEIRSFARAAEKAFENLRDVRDQVADYISEAREAGM
jgi:hypothetical protein